MKTVFLNGAVVAGAGLSICGALLPDTPGALGDGGAREAAGEVLDAGGGVRHSAVGRIEMYPAGVGAPGVAGDSGVGDGEAAVGGREVHPAGDIAPGVFVRRVYGATCLRGVRERGEREEEEKELEEVAAKEASGALCESGLWLVIHG